MKLTLFQLEAHLAKPLAPVYLLHGDEMVLKQDAASMVRKAAGKAGYTERLRIAAESGFNWDELYAALHENSLFASQRLIELDCRDAAPPKEASAILAEYAKNPAPNNILLIETGKLDAKVTKSAWYTAIEKAGVAIAIWPISLDQIPQWVVSRAKKYKMTIQQDAATLLSEYVEGNLIAAAQIIEKAYLLKPAAAIDIELLNLVLTDESRFTVFDLTDTLVAGDASRALHVLETLRQDGTDPVLVLWSLTRELRLLAEMAGSLKQGDNAEMIFQKHRIFSRRQPALRRFLSKKSAADCQASLVRAAHIDRVIKGAVQGNPWQALQLLCLRFA